MKKSVSFLVVASLSLFLASSAFAQDDGIPEDVKADAELVIEVFNSMAKVITANLGDCAKLGVALEKWGVDNKEKITKMQGSMTRLTSLPPEKDELMEKLYGPRMKDVEDAMMKLVECAADPKVVGALEMLMPVEATE